MLTRKRITCEQSSGLLLKKMEPSPSRHFDDMKKSGVGMGMGMGMAWRRRSTAEHQKEMAWNRSEQQLKSMGKEKERSSVEHASFEKIWKAPLGISQLKTTDDMSMMAKLGKSEKLVIGPANGDGVDLEIVGIGHISDADDPYLIDGFVWKKVEFPHVTQSKCILPPAPTRHQRQCGIVKTGMDINSRLGMGMANCQGNGDELLLKDLPFGWSPRSFLELGLGDPFEVESKVGNKDSELSGEREDGDACEEDVKDIVNDDKASAAVDEPFLIDSRKYPVSVCDGDILNQEFEWSRHSLDLDEDEETCDTDNDDVVISTSSSRYPTVVEIVEQLEKRLDFICIESGCEEGDDVHIRDDSWKTELCKNYMSNDSKCRYVSSLPQCPTSTITIVSIIC